MKIIPTPLGFPLFIPGGNRGRDISDERLKKTVGLYEEYCALIKKNFNPSEGLYELKYQDNDDPWSPGHYFIIRKIHRTGWRKIFGDRNIAVMEILSEPEFAEGHSDAGLPCVGLKIRIADPAYKKAILKFAESYESMFKKKIKIK